MSGIDSLNQTNQLRESDNLLKSLQSSDQALFELSEEKNPAKFAETLAARSLTLRHLFQKSGDKNYLLVAKAEMQTSVEIARSLDDKTALALPLFNLAKVYAELAENEEAIKVFKEALTAIEHNPPESHNRPAVIADFKIHLATAELKNGDHSARIRLEQFIKDLAESDEDLFNKNVWLSGAYMNLAHLLQKQDPKAAKEYLQKSKEIIDSDHRLILRKKQWQKLADNVSS